MHLLKCLLLLGQIKKSLRASVRLRAGVSGVLFFLFAFLPAFPAYSQSAVIPQELYIKSPGYTLWWDSSKSGGCFIDGNKISMMWSECYSRINFIEKTQQNNLVCRLPGISSLFTALYAFITSLFGLIAISKILKAIFNES